MKKMLLLVLSTCIAGAAFASPITDRQDIFKQYKKLMGDMGKAVKSGTIDKVTFSKNASELEALSQKPWQYFPAGSGTGKTDAKPEIWSKPAEWQKSITSHKAATAGFKKVAATGDVNAIKKSFADLQKTCKACHDTFRKDS